MSVALILPPGPSGRRRFVVHDVRDVSRFSTRLRFCLVRGITVMQTHCTALERKPPCGSVANTRESQLDRGPTVRRWSAVS